jgi:hypothetical protein
VPVAVAVAFGVLFLAVDLAVVLVAWRTVASPSGPSLSPPNGRATWQSDTWNNSQRGNDGHFLYIYICFNTSHAKSVIVVTYKLL